MESFIQSTSLKMWDIFESDFDFKPRGNWTEKEKNLFSLNIRAMQILYKDLAENDFQKIKHCSNARDIWNTLDAMYASNHSLGSKAVQSSFCAPCGSTDEVSESELQFSDRLSGAKHGELVEFFHQHLNASCFYSPSSRVSSLKSLPHIFSIFVVTDPVELLRTESTLDVVHGPIIQLD